MAAIGYVYDEKTTDTPHTGDTSFFDVLTMAKEDFVANATYILIITAQLHHNASTNHGEARVVHGTTPTKFIGSDFRFEAGDNATTANRHTYGFLYKWTVPATTEDVKFQIRNVDATGDTVRASGVTMLAIRLDADLTEGKDWAYGEDDDSGAPTTHTSTHVSFASTGAFTPDNASDDWMVVAMHHVLINSLNRNCEVRIDRDSETEIVPLWSEEGEDTEEYKCRLLMRVYSLTAAAHTFTVQARDDNTGLNDHNFSTIFALRLNVFEGHDKFWNEAEQTFSVAGDWEQINGFASYTPTTARDHVLIAFAAADQPNTPFLGNIRFQVGGTTAPVGKDSNWDSRVYDTEDESPMFCLAVVNMSGAQDIDFDGRMDDIAAGSPNGKTLLPPGLCRLVFTLVNGRELELPSAAGSAFKGYSLKSVFSTQTSANVTS